MRRSLLACATAVLLVAGCSTPRFRDYWGEGRLYKAYRLGHWTVQCSRFDEMRGDEDVEICRASQTLNGTTVHVQREPRELEVMAYFNNCTSYSGFELPQPQFIPRDTRGEALLAVVEEVLGTMNANSTAGADCGKILDIESKAMNVADLYRFLDRTDDLKVHGAVGPE